jgi:hypothetical protein
MPEKFDIYSKIFYMDVEKFVRHLCRLVLRHQMPVWNYFVNSFYSVGNADQAQCANNIKIIFRGFLFMFGPPLLLAQGASVRH